MTYRIIRSNLHGSPHNVLEMCKMASTKCREKAFARAVGLGTSLTLMGKAEVKGLEGVSHGFRSVAPWTVEPLNVGSWMQLVSENHPHGLRSYKMRYGRVVEVVFSFA
jgi:hypothetical protein